MFQTDIHPAAAFGQGIFLDHATGLVVGATSVIDDDVSILQNVTLGGTGNEADNRHPKVHRGVMIGAGAKILGNIEIGACSRIAAGSVVLHPVPLNTTMAGVPARAVGTAGCAEPSRRMNQILSQLAYPTRYSCRSGTVSIGWQLRQGRPPSHLLLVNKKTYIFVVSVLSQAARGDFGKRK